MEPGIVYLYYATHKRGTMASKTPVLLLLAAATMACAYTDWSEYNPCDIYAQDGTYLGNTGNQYDPNSVNNPYGKYGSQYSPTSINNPYGNYGSQYSTQSPNNPYTTHLPTVYDRNGNRVGKLKLRDKYDIQDGYSY